MHSTLSRIKKLLPNGESNMCMKRRTLIYLVLFMILSSMAYGHGESLKDMHVEVKYSNYHCLFTIRDNKAYYEDRYHSLNYFPQSEWGITVMKYWQEDFFKLFRYHDNIDISESSRVYFRLEDEGEWRIADSNETEGKLLLSFLSRIQRFPLEERYCLDREKE